MKNKETQPSTRTTSTTVTAPPDPLTGLDHIADLTTRGVYAEMIARRDAEVRAKWEEQSPRSPLQREDGSWVVNAWAVQAAKREVPGMIADYPALIPVLTLLEGIEDDHLGCPWCLRTGLIAAFLGPAAGDPNTPRTWSVAREERVQAYPPQSRWVFQSETFHALALASMGDVDADGFSWSDHACTSPVPGVISHVAPWAAGASLPDLSRSHLLPVPGSFPSEVATLTSGDPSLRVLLLLVADQRPSLDDCLWLAVRLLVGIGSLDRVERYTGCFGSATAPSGMRDTGAGAGRVAVEDWLVNVLQLADRRTPPPTLPKTDVEEMRERIAALEARLTSE